MKHDFYHKLPDGYRQDKVVDAKNTRFAILMNVAAVLLIVLVYVLTDLLMFGRITLGDLFTVAPGDDGSFAASVVLPVLPLLCLLPSFFVYVVLHELTHGAVYKILTGEKLTFGITWSAAYCGVPNLYVSKRIALTALLAPFVVFTALGIPAIILSGLSGVGFLFRFLFAMHVSGCVGDLYDSFLLIFRYRNGCLVHDNGPTQVFYVRDAGVTPES